MKRQFTDNPDSGSQGSSPRYDPRPKEDDSGFASRSFPGALPPAELEAIRQAATPVALPARRTLSGSTEGDAVYLLGEGLAACVLPLKDGRRLGLSLEGRGSLIGGGRCFEGAPAALEEATMLIPGSGWRVSRRVLADLAQARPGLALALARHFAERNAELQAELACSLLHGIVPRLARGLVQAFHLAGSPTLTVTQEELAVLLRTQRTTVSEALGHLKAQGAVSHLRGAVRLLDEARLRAIGCGCSAAALA